MDKNTIENQESKSSKIMDSKVEGLKWKGMRVNQGCSFLFYSKSDMYDIVESLVGFLFPPLLNELQPWHPIGKNRSTLPQTSSS